MDYETLQFDFPPTGRVNLFRIGDTLVDSGHLAPPCVDGVASELADGSLTGIERVLVTHPHVDHVGGSQAILGLTELPHIVYEGSGHILKNYRDHVRNIRTDIERFVPGPDADLSYFETSYPLDFDYPDDIPIERRVADGDELTLGNESFEVIHTPGHSAYQLSLAHESSGLIFSGDAVLPHQHFMWGPINYDVGDQRDSLRRLRERRPEVLVPSHGYPIEDTVSHIDGCIANLDRTLETLRETIETNGRLVLDDIVDDLFSISGVTGPARHFFLCTAGTFVDYLAERGEVTTAETDEGFVAIAP